MFASLVWGVLPAQAISLDAALLPGIQAATFEVVAAKPENDPLRYEKPLPLDLIPFQERNDKYYSIGTAFSIGDGRYVTAAHVLLVGVNSLWGAPALRDNGGHVYAIDKVLKFSLERDFVVFSLKQAPPNAALPIASAATSGQAVFSVGNAYGTGVVIRDGLYTSDTPEQQDGRWKWMRFSAAASPGNSGGPLVDQSGKVIGVVLAKSPNENLNYALPIGLVQSAPDDVAEIDTRVSYQLDIFDTILTNPYQDRFALPLDLQAFFATYARHTNAFMDAQIKALLAKDPQQLFPNGAGSQELLHQIADMGDLPHLISRDNNGKWALAGSSDDNVKLSANGYITPGKVGHSWLFHLRRPDDVPAARLYTDPSVAMDLLLKLGNIKRTVGNQDILVTSLGKPDVDTWHTDAWGRKWQIREWPIPHANGKLVLMLLPVPDGYSGIGRYAEASDEHVQLNDLKALTDFVYVNYDGTLSQWRDFLTQPLPRPDVFKNISLDVEFDKRFAYSSPRLDLAFGPDLQAIGPTSTLTLGFAFASDRGRVTWDVGELWLSATSTDNDYVLVARQSQPPADLGDDFTSDWQKMTARRHPYDATVRQNDDVSKITAIVGPPASAQPGLLYSAQYATEGSQPQDAMKAKLDLLLKALSIKEF